MRSLAWGLALLTSFSTVTAQSTGPASNACPTGVNEHMLAPEGRISNGRPFEQCSRDQDASANIIVTADSTAVRTSGLFLPIDAYLSRSAKVLKSGGGHNNATFSAEIKTPGFYRIYVWWPQVTTDAGSIQVFVQHAGGTTAAIIDQRRLGGQWNPIGVFELHQTQATVQLVDQPGVAAYVDAVRFQFVGKSRPALDLETDELPLGIKGDVYAASVKVFSGVRPHRWSVSAGRVPSGLSLGLDDGLISGTPREAGRFHIMLKQH